VRTVESQLQRGYEMHCGSSRASDVDTARRGVAGNHLETPRSQTQGAWTRSGSEGERKRCPSSSFASPAWPQPLGGRPTLIMRTEVVEVAVAQPDCSRPEGNAH
jgi:TnpA family transposase